MGLLLVSEEKLVLEQKRPSSCLWWSTVALTMEERSNSMGAAAGFAVHSPDWCYHPSAVYIIIFKASTPIYKL